MAESLPFQQRKVPHPAPSFLWFLLQLEDAPSLYIVIHRVDILEGLRTVYYDRKLKFLKDQQTVLCGLVICASDERSFIEEELQKIIVSTPDARPYSHEDYYKNYHDESQGYNWFLVQYSKGPSNVIHAIVHRNDVSWHSVEKANQREVLVCDGDVQHLATVLYISHSQTEIMEQLYNLKEKCVTYYAQYLENEKDNGTSSMTLQPLHQQNSLEPWMLVQYSCGPNNYVYAVVNLSETVWQEENKYPDVVAYLSDGSNLYQSVIMKKSFEREEVCNELQNIRERCLITILPINGEYEDLHFDYSQKSKRRKIEENHTQTTTTITHDKCIQTDFLSSSSSSGKKKKEDKSKMQVGKEDVMALRARLEMIALTNKNDEKQIEIISNKMDTFEQQLIERLRLLTDAVEQARTLRR